VIGEAEEKAARAIKFPRWLLAGGTVPLAPSPPGDRGGQTPASLPPAPFRISPPSLLLQEDPPSKLVAPVKGVAGIWSSAPRTVEWRSNPTRGLFAGSAARRALPCLGATPQANVSSGSPLPLVAAVGHSGNGGWLERLLVGDVRPALSSAGTSGRRSSGYGWWWRCRLLRVERQL
jgi:hypothetical protein